MGRPHRTVRAAAAAAAAARARASRPRFGSQPLSAWARGAVLSGTKTEARRALSLFRRRYMAACLGRGGAVRALVAGGADVNLADDCGVTPLWSGPARARASGSVVGG